MKIFRTGKDTKILELDTGDWLSNPKLKMVDYFTKGVWFELICYMVQSEHYGFLIFAGKSLQKDDIIELLHPKEMDKFHKTWDILVNSQILKKDTDGTFYSSRLVNDYWKRHPKEFAKLKQRELLDERRKREEQKLEKLKEQEKLKAEREKQKEQEKEQKRALKIQQEKEKEELRRKRELEKQQKKIFVPPTIEEIQAYMKELQVEEKDRFKENFDPVKCAQEFYDKYSKRNWILNKNPIPNIKLQCKQFASREFVQDKMMAEFDEARRLYPGMKNGLFSEFENFKKQHDWQESVFKLKVGIEKEKTWRLQLHKGNARFIPQWKNFQTWINKRCWEQEFMTDKIGLFEEKGKENLGPIKAGGR